MCLEGEHNRGTGMLNFSYPKDMLRDDIKLNSTVFLQNLEI